MLKIGVRLPRQFDDSGDYLADARAMDSAGADSLWLDAEGYDPWLLLAGMATITGRVRLVVPVSSADVRGPGDLGEKAATLSRLSRGRAALAVTGLREGAAGVEVVIELARRAQCCVILETASDRRAGLADGVVVAGESAERFRAAVEPVTRFRERLKLTGPFELWASIKMPDDRETWRRLRREYEDAGATGIIVPSDPRLLDLLRNGDEEDDRSDLGLAQG
jgi:alkanesulfonate monooxygenase SsuD/methylene tetrahydromethanopterin reductase-like flavin-dependent oxidoreductase (luciferase family)